MNLKDYEYLLAVNEVHNIRKAAEKMYITPSALTQKIQSVEQELGVQLFIRSNAGCFTTENGEIFLKTARTILKTEEDMKRELHDRTNLYKGVLKIGLPPDRGADMFMYIYPRFHEQYPEISFSLVETSTRNIIQMVTENKLNLGIIGTTKERITGCNMIVLRNEHPLAVFPDTLLSKGQDTLAGSDRPAAPSESAFDLTILKDEPFALVSKESTTRAWQDQILERYGITPKVVFETARASTIARMVSMKLCCSIITDYYCRDKLEGVEYRELSIPFSWNICAITDQSGYMDRPQQEFIRLAGEFLTR